MSKLQRFIRLSLIPMMFLLPLLLTVGRMALGVAGFFTIFMILFIVPVVFVSLFIIAALITARSDVKSSGKVSNIDVIMVSVLYISILIYGFFVIDGGDSVESTASVATLFFGRGLLNLSEAIDSVFKWLSAILLLASMVIALIELINDKRLKKSTK